jgi:hypothetical protein
MQQITNPLCPERLVEQMRTWLRDEHEDLIKGLEVASDEVLPCEHAGDDFCIVTGNKMSICVYCYTEHIFNWLLSTNPDKELLNEFMTYFNFDEGRRGYWRVADKLGFIP